MDCWASCCAPRPTAANRQKQVDNLTANARSSPSPPFGGEGWGEEALYIVLPLFLCENLGSKTKAPGKILHLTPILMLASERKSQRDSAIKPKGCEQRATLGDLWHHSPQPQ